MDDLARLDMMRRRIEAGWVQARVYVPAYTTADELGHGWATGYFKLDRQSEGVPAFCTVGSGMEGNEPPDCLIGVNERPQVDAVCWLLGFDGLGMLCAWNNARARTKRDVLDRIDEARERVLAERVEVPAELVPEPA